VIVVAFLYLAGRKPAAASTSTTAATNPLSSALKSLASALSPAKSSGGSGGGSSGGGSAGNMGSAAAGSASGSSLFTPVSTIDALATDGSASDAQVAAYLGALNQGNTDLANAIIGNVAPVDTTSDPQPYAGVISPVVDPGTYQAPTMDYSPPAVLDDGSYDGGDSGDGDDGDDSGD